MQPFFAGFGEWEEPGDTPPARFLAGDAAGDGPRVPDPVELGRVALRVARYAGELELDVLELGFLLQSVPEAAHLRDWIRRRLAALLADFAAWPWTVPADEPAAGDPPRCPAAATLVGVAAVLGAVERHRSADARDVWSGAGTHERACIAEGARLALAAEGPALERAWGRTVAVWRAAPAGPRP